MSLDAGGQETGGALKRRVVLAVLPPSETEAVGDDIPAAAGDGPLIVFLRIIKGTPAKVESADPGDETEVKTLYAPSLPGPGAYLKPAFEYAIALGFDAVAVLEKAPRITSEGLAGLSAPITEGNADAVYGYCPRTGHASEAPSDRPISRLGRLNRRLIVGWSARWSGCRAFRVEALRTVPFTCNSDGPSFDAELLVQLGETGKKIVEAPITCPAVRRPSAALKFHLAAAGALALFRSRIMRWGIYYRAAYDYQPGSNTVYEPKFAYDSSHRFALDRVPEGATVLDIGSGPGYLAAALSSKKARVISLDRQIRPETVLCSWKTIQADAETHPLESIADPIDVVLLLDMIEHLKSPERLLRGIRLGLGDHPRLVIVTTGNIAFLPMRISLMLGLFNYGKRGILDLDHTRLYTFATLARLLREQGYEIKELRGIPAPFPLAMGDNAFSRLLLFLNRLLIGLRRTLFAYQIAAVAVPLPPPRPVPDGMPRKGPPGDG